MELGLIIYRIMEGGGKVEGWKQNTKLLINTIEKSGFSLPPFHLFYCYFKYYTFELGEKGGK
jgi:hypothetical protein